MSPLPKLLTGLAATGVLVWASLMPFGGAAGVADDLENRTATALQDEGAADVLVRVPRRPVRRVVHLSGDYPDALRLRAREIALAQFGVAGAIWDVEAPAADDASVAANARRCQAELEALTADDQINFRSGSAYINPVSARLIDRIAEAARGCDGVTIEIAGHTDNRGSANVNREMSAFRATAVRDALAERGVAAEMMTTVGKGSDEPLADDPADPANRRIEFIVRPASGEAAS